MFKNKNSIELCKNIIPEFFNNKDIEFLDNSLYNSEIFDKCKKLNNNFIKFMLKSEKENKNFSDMIEENVIPSADFIKNFEKRLDDLSVEYKNISDTAYNLQISFFQHLKNIFDKK